MHKITRILLLIFLAGLLVLVRFFEDTLFYDPLLAFFKSEFINQPLPEMDLPKLLGNVFFRYWANALISLAILYFVFKESGVLKLSVLIYAGLFVLLFVAFYVLLLSGEIGNQMPLFYVRRFLIQPIFLLILLPAFYFHRKNPR